MSNLIRVLWPVVKSFAVNLSNKRDRIVKRFLGSLWSLVVAILFPALAAVCVSNAIAINAELNTDTYAITIVRLGLGAVFIAVACLFVLKKSNI